jgi:hypothetical protein
MNKKLIFLIPLSALVMGCDGPSVTPVLTSQISNCKAGPVAIACPSEEAKRKTVTIRVTPHRIIMSPPVVCAAHGADITVDIDTTSVPGDVTVVTVPKDADDGWIVNSSGPGGSSMTIKVPEDTTVGPMYGYFIVTSNGQCLDPKIHVDK